ncbi:hypothetical protein SAMN05444274_11077 [Mariniphaga anaerophila]|uniref:Tetratricopeptide repeat-containing protein n=1 Tax=Mariniphaga anaerophila TaxID=1484053 RepID=A0A1M5EYA0_9BACT|nr:hypothetical protein [Mariniphaga anaerophila]SHF84126.1 hypothetical protein SAMN05444274_11077 [Mariniphaga anaerophila]
MRNKNLIILLLALVIVSCGAPKNLISYKENAELAASGGNYTEATKAWKEYFAQFPGMNELDGAEYARAAQTAMKAGDSGLAVEWFDQARYKNYGDAEMYATLAGIYQEQGNLSKELSALEFLKTNFENESSNINNRLFSIYDETGMKEKALEAWDDLSQEEKSSEQNLEKYFLLNREKGNDQLCDSVSIALLNVNPENVPALEWTAPKIYHFAEKRYQTEMANYEKNRTRSQYRILLKELDKVTADFKKSLGYFEKLWKLRPDSRKEYAGYMSNIYVRFNDEKKAAYYRNFLD